LDQPEGILLILLSCEIYFTTKSLASRFQEVSLSHLFLPLHVSSDSETSLQGLPLGLSKKHSGLYSLSAGLPDCMDQEVAGPGVPSTAKSFPWSFFSEHHGVREVLLHYHPLCLDNLEHFVGTHISAFPLEGYTVRRDLVFWAHPVLPIPVLVFI